MTDEIRKKRIIDTLSGCVNFGDPVKFYNDLIQLKAEKLARKIVLRTNQNMKLEDQGIGDEKIAETIKELANEIKREMRKSLWD